MDLLDPAPTLRRFGPEAEGVLLQQREPGLGEYLGASVREGWWNTTLGAGQALLEAERGEQRDPTPLSEQEWRASPLYREGVPYDPRMTRGRAEAIARVFDENAYRRRLMGARDPGALETVLGFGAQVVGSVADPVNFLPVAGPGARALRALGGAPGAAIAGRLEAATIRAGIGRGVIDAVGGTAASLPFVYSAQEQFGEEITWARAVADLSIGAVIGAAFGGVGGALAARAARAVDPVAADAVVRSMAGDVAAGRPVEMPAAVMRSAIDETIVRTAPDDAAPFIRERDEGGRIVREADLPRRSDGAPLTREEFDEELRAREMAMRAERGEAVTEADVARAAADEAMAQSREALALVRRLRRGERFTRGEKSLTQFVVEAGGLRDFQGEVRAVLKDGPRRRPGLLNNARGRGVDDMGEAAREAGYFRERPTVEEFLAALDDDLSGLSPNFGRTVDDAGRQMEAAADDLMERMARAGVGLDDTDEAIARALYEHPREEAYGWYRSSLEAQDRARALQDSVDARAGSDAPEAREADPAPTSRDGEADPEMEAIAAEIEEARRAGRITAADDAELRAGDDAAAEIEAQANGLEQAAVCMLGRAA